MHIGLLSPEWPLGESANGIVTYVHYLRLGLLELGHRVSVFTGGVGQSSDVRGVHLVEEGMKHRFLNKLSRLRPSPLPDAYRWGHIIADAVNQLHRTDPLDILEMGESFGLCADVAKRVSIPVVVKLHGPAFLTLVDEDRDTAWAHQRMKKEGEALRTISTVIAPSRSALEQTFSHYHLTPALYDVIPNPLPLPPSGEPWSIEQADPKTLLFVGRFDKAKGGDIVLRVFRRLLDTDKTLKLLFVGPDNGVASSDGSRVSIDNFIDSMFSAHERSNIIYYGRLPKDQISPLRRKSFATIVASRWESQGYTALEAMAEGCPVVVSDTGGLRELIEPGVTGLVARCQDVDDFYQKIRSLLENASWAAELGKSARAYVGEHFSPTTISARTVDIYSQSIRAFKARSR